MFNTLRLYSLSDQSFAKTAHFGRVFEKTALLHCSSLSFLCTLQAEDRPRSGCEHVPRDHGDESLSGVLLAAALFYSHLHNFLPKVLVPAFIVGHPLQMKLVSLETSQDRRCNVTEPRSHKRHSSFTCYVCFAALATSTAQNSILFTMFALRIYPPATLAQEKLAVATRNVCCFPLCSTDRFLRVVFIWHSYALTIIIIIITIIIVIIPYSNSFNSNI